MLRGRRLHEHEPDLHPVLRPWEMLDPFGDNVEFAGVKLDRFPVAKIKEQGSFVDEEQLIFVDMVVPDEFTLYFSQLDLLAVEFANDFGGPLIGEEGEFLEDVGSETGPCC